MRNIMEASISILLGLATQVIGGMLLLLYIVLTNG